MDGASVGVVRATSDLHLTEHTAPWVFEALEELRQDAAVHGGCTILAGDILDQPHTIHAPSFMRLRQLLRSFNGLVYVIAGNHDQYAAPDTPLSALEGGDVHVVTVPTATAWGVMLPYTKPDMFRLALESVKRHKGCAPVVWSHHGFRGAYRNAMMRDTDGVSVADVPAGQLVITGHYHCPQTVGRVIYCGSPYQTTFAEEGQTKGWLRWEDFDADLMPKRIAYEGVAAPRHWTVDWDPDAGPPVRPSGATEHDRIRVRTVATRKQVQAATSQLAAAGLEGVSVIAAPAAGRVDGVALTGTPWDAADAYMRRIAGQDGRPSADTLDAWARRELSNAPSS